ncbi:hypothetical protein DITRI_Ditri10aG0156100 [Diplodiscus trichospermus]
MFNKIFSSWYMHILLSHVFHVLWSLKLLDYKMPADELKTVKDHKGMFAKSMFLHALNQRFFKISHRKDPPYFSCSAAADALVARVRLHGFSEREVSVVRALLMSEIESAYLEHDQMQSTNLRDEYIQVYEATSQGSTLVMLALPFKIQEEGCSSVRESLTPSTAQSALQRILPYPCKNQYTAFAEKLGELKREKQANTKPDPDNDFFMKAWRSENRKKSNVTVSGHLKTTYNC